MGTDENKVNQAKVCFTCYKNIHNNDFLLETN